MMGKEEDQPGHPDFKPEPFQTNEEMDRVIEMIVQAHDKLVKHSNRTPADHILAENRKTIELVEEKLRTFGRTNITLKDFDEFYRATGKPLDNRREIMAFHVEKSKAWISGYIKWCKTIPGFQELNYNDRVILLKYARIEIWYLGSYPGYDNEHGVAVMPNGRTFNKAEMMNVWAKPYIDTCYGLSEKFKKVDATPEELVLLKCVCLLQSERGEPMQRHDQVQALQEQYAKMLHYLVHKNHTCTVRPGFVGSTFARLLDLLCDLRDLQESEMKNFEDENSVYNYQGFRQTDIIQVVLPETINRIHKEAGKDGEARPVNKKMEDNEDEGLGFRPVLYYKPDFSHLREFCSIQ